MAKLSGASNMDPSKMDLELSTILEVKGFAVDELSRQIDAFLQMPNAKQRDFKAATIALKALVHATVEKTHRISADAVEHAAMFKQAELFGNPRPDASAAGGLWLG